MNGAGWRWLWSKADKVTSFSLQEIGEATGASPVTRASLPPLFEGVSTDSRKVQPGQLFVPLVGENFDGHDYLSQALAAGAAGALWSRQDSPAGPLLRVQDTLTAYQQLGAFHRRRLRIPVIAVTGSTGKTTTKDLIAALLSSRYQVHKTEANYNNDIGVPLTLLQLTSQHQVAVLELAMRGQGQIRRLAKLVDARVGLITNIGTSHIELLGSQDAICDAKGELVECLKPDSLAVLPLDSPYFERLRAKTTARVAPFSLKDCQADNLGVEGWRVKMKGCEFTFGLPGTHHLEDLMAAFKAVEPFGLAPADCAQGLVNFRPSGLRMEQIRLPGDVLILNDAYNAAPESVEGALEVLCSADGRKVAVLGDMLEMGEHAPEGHRRVGRACLSRGVDLLIAVGPESRATAEAAQGLTEVVWVADALEAGQVLNQRLSPGDRILLKASRGIGLEKVLQALKGAVT